jgi:hypothetical protein
MMRSVHRRSNLEQVGDEIGKAAPFLIGTGLEPLVQLPMGRKGDPLRAPAQQINRSHRTSSPVGL